MTEEATTWSARAAALAQWTQLSDDSFGNCYISVRGGKAMSWEVIVALPDTPLRLKACQVAEDHGFLEALARAIANWEERIPRPPVEIAAMLDEVCGYGVMQGMTDQQKGFMDAEILMPLLRARDACAAVVATGSGESLRGTAFLVKPDLVLTAAHVVLKIGTVDNKKHWIEELQDGLVFRFRAKPGHPQHHLFEVRPAAAKLKPLVSCSLPYGEPPNRLERQINGEAKGKLDYALVRLAQRVEHVGPVEIVDVTSVSKGKTCWAFGFPGGNALMMDVDIVMDISAEGGRWLHKANAAPGMSGGCCVNHEGRVAGLHEGTLDETVDGNKAVRNRGINIADIRRKQCEGGHDPLKSRSNTPGLEFQDSDLVGEWYQTGKRLGGDAHAAKWHERATQVIGADPEAAAELPAFHPWFARADVEQWIDAAVGNERLCLVYGATGTGKSFCLRILREKLASRDVELVVFNPTQLNAMDWTDAISQVLVPHQSDYRTAAASIRYGDIGAVLDELKRRSAGGTRNCHVAMDFGPAGNNARFTGTPWLELVVALAAAEGIKLLMIGLDEFERAALMQRLDSRPETQNVVVTETELLAPSAGDFLKYARKLATARGTVLGDKQIRDEVNQLLSANPALSPELEMVTAVRTAIEFAAKL